MSRSLAYLAIVTAMGAAVLHLLTLLGSAPVSATQLRPTIAVAAAVTVAYLMWWRREKATGAAEGWLPNWILGIDAAVVIYAFLTYFLERYANGGGYAEVVGGKTMLLRKGEVIRELDAQGISDLAVWKVRALTAYLLPFLVIPGLALLFPARVRPRRLPRIKPKVAAPKPPLPPTDVL